MRTGYLLTLFSSLMAAAAIGTAPALSTETEMVPDGILAVSSGHCIIVEKATQKLHLYQSDGDRISLAKTYQCSTGKNRGDKIQSGDQRTPEGIYYFTRQMSDEQLEPRYGVMAFVLDFPNRLDKVEDKQGNGIWLHGLDKPLQPFDSKGCVALENGDIVELGRSIRLYETPIIIEEKMPQALPEDVQRQRAEALDLVTAWQRSWVEKQVDPYMACYSREALGQAAWQQLRGHKAGLNEKYKFIDVDMRGLSILQHEGTMLAAFVQDYESNSFASMGLKKLYLRHNSETLKVVAEEWKPLHLEAKARGEGASEQRQVCRLLNSWITAWEGGELSSYMKCYGPTFKSQGMDLNGWRQYKAGLMGRGRRVRLTVATPVITIVGEKARVSYVQTYASASHSDQGVKSLELEKDQAGWRIIGEAWEAL